MPLVLPSLPKRLVRLAPMCAQVMLWLLLSAISVLCGTAPIGATGTWLPTLVDRILILGGEGVPHSLLRSGICPEHCSTFRTVPDVPFVVSREGGTLTFNSSGRLLLSTFAFIDGLRDFSAHTGVEEATLALTHLRAIEAAYRAGLQSALILDSDVTIGFTLDSHLAATIAALDEGWTILQLCLDTVVGPAAALELFNSYLQGVYLQPRDAGGLLDCSAAYIVHRRGMEEILGRHWPGFVKSPAQREQDSGKLLAHYDSLELAGALDFRAAATKVSASAIVLDCAKAFIATRPVAYISTSGAVPPWAGRLMTSYRLAQPSAVSQGSPVVADAENYLFMHPTMFRFGSSIDMVKLTDAATRLCTNVSDFCYYPLLIAARNYLRTAQAPQGGVRLVYVFESALHDLRWANHESPQAALDALCLGKEPPLAGRLDFVCRSLRAAAISIHSLNNAYAVRPPPRPAVTTRRLSQGVGPIRGFWHIAAVGSLWSMVARDQLQSIQESGLLAVSEVVNAVLLGPTAPIASELWTAGFTLTDAGQDLSRFEYATLLMLQDYCESEPAGKVWYIHSKGANAGLRNMSCVLPVMAWRRMMEHFVLTRHSECVGALDQGFDTCGALYTNDSTYAYYAGNFWWAKCSYINRLPSLRSFDLSNRYWAEVWIGLAEAWKPRSCYPDGDIGDLYFHTLDPEDYIHTPPCDGGP